MKTKNFIFAVVAVLLVLILGAGGSSIYSFITDDSPRNFTCSIHMDTSKDSTYTIHTDMPKEFICSIHSDDIPKNYTCSLVSGLIALVALIELMIFLHSIKYEWKKLLEQDAHEQEQMQEKKSSK